MGKVGMVVHIYNSGTWEAKAGGLQAQGQPGLHNETLFKKKKKKLQRLQMTKKAHESSSVLQEMQIRCHFIPIKTSIIFFKDSN
jgi:hypothetical protein